MTLQLDLLGSPRLLRDGTPLKVDRRKALALLAYLAVTARPHSRLELATLLWDGYTDAAALAYLRRELWTLNELAPGLIDADRDTVALMEAALVCDVIVFRSNLAHIRTHGHAATVTCAACAEALKAATDLYRGAFMEGFSVRDGVPFENWQRDQAEMLRREQADALEKLAEHSTHTPDVSLRLAQRWLALDPLNEAAHRLLMRLHTTAGNRSAALQQYQQCVDLLRRDLNAAPQPETTRLYLAARENALTTRRAAELVAPVVEAPSSPTPPTPFIERSEDLRHLARLLADPGCTLLTLVGPGGIGKTRLALETTRRLSDQFADGAYFVPLVGLSDPEHLIPAIANSVGYQFYRHDDLKTQLIDFLANKHLLLTLDNFEQLLAGAAVLAELTANAPRLKLLITSRERLNLRSEWTFEVQGLDVPPAHETPSADSVTGYPAYAEYSAIRLFHDCARRVGATLNEGDMPHIIDICRLVGGMPLAIELAAAWTRALTCAEIAVELRQSLDFLQTSMRDMPARHWSLRAVFDASWQTLTDAERGLFSRLSIFRGGFRREAAQQVASASLALLSTLLDKSLIRRTEDGRYELHEMLRQYAETKLVGASRAEAQDRHADYFMTFIAARHDRLRGADEIAAVREITEELENIRVAWSHTIADSRVDLISKGVQIVQYYNVVGYQQEAMDILERAAACLRALPPTREVEITLAHALVGLRWFCEDDFKATYVSNEFVEEGIALLRKHHADQHLAFALYVNGHHYINVSQWETGERLFNEANQHARAKGDLYDIVLTQAALAYIYDQRGDYDSSIATCQEALALARRIENASSMAHILVKLTNVCRLQGYYADAQRYATESIALRRTLGSWWGEADAANNLALVLKALGNYEEALAISESSLRAFERAGSMGGMASTLNDLGVIARAQGRLQDALHHHRQAFDLFEVLGSTWGMAFGANDIGLVLHLLNDRDGAQQWYERGTDLARHTGNRYDLTVGLCRQAVLACERDQLELADGWLAEAETLALAMNVRPLMMLARYGSAFLAFRRGELTTAGALCAEVVTTPATDHELRQMSRHLATQIGTLSATGMPQ
jgi:predicted ATPase/DNA-binding SARP family transcriptional activator